MPQPPFIVVYGQEITLLNTRAWILERDGFDVEAVSSMEELKLCTKSNPVALLILCHSLSSAQVADALAQKDEGIFQQLLFVSGRSTKMKYPAFPAFDPLSGPEVFINCVRNLMAKRDNR